MNILKSLLILLQGGRSGRRGENRDQGKREEGKIVLKKEDAAKNAVLRGQEKEEDKEEKQNKERYSIFPISTFFSNFILLICVAITFLDLVFFDKNFDTFKKHFFTTIFIHNIFLYIIYFIHNIFFPLLTNKIFKGILFHAFRFF